MEGSRVDRAVEAVERRLGRVGAGTLLVLLLLAGTAVAVCPTTRPQGQGIFYARLAENPLDSRRNHLGYRLLTPLVSHSLGLGGRGILVTNAVLAAAVVALVYAYYRRRSPRPGDAVLAAATIAFSMVTWATLALGGYVDSMTYLIVFAMYALRRHRVLFYPLLLLGLTNHESVAFVAPWFALLHLTERRSVGAVLELALGFGLVAGAYLGYRGWAAGLRPISYSVDYYTGPLSRHPLHWFSQSYPHQTLGLFTVFKVLWLVPVAAAVAHWRDRAWRPLLLMAALLACVWSQMLIAFDSTRMLTLGFLVMVLALDHLFDRKDGTLRRWLPSLLLLNLLVPTLYTEQQKIAVLPSLPAKLFAQIALGQDVPW